MLKSIFKYAILPYTVTMLYFMFIGMERSQYEHNIVRIVPVFSTLKFIREANYVSEALFIVFANLVMFIPYGFLGWILPKCRNLKYLIFNFISVITILEALQYFSRMGVFDIDDIIINTFGVYIGFHICILLEVKLKRFVYKNPNTSY